MANQDYGVRLVGENLDNPNKSPLINPNFQKDMSYLRKIGAISSNTEIFFRDYGLETVDEVVEYISACFDKSFPKSARNSRLKRVASGFNILDTENLPREVAQTMDILTTYASKEIERKYGAKYVDGLNDNIKRMKRGKKIRSLEVMASN